MAKKLLTRTIPSPQINGTIKTKIKVIINAVYCASETKHSL